MDLNQYLEYTRNTEMLLQTLSYIQAYKGKTVVIQIGEDLLHHENYIHMILQDAVLLKSVGIHPVIVHGGGEEESGLRERFPVPQFSVEEQKMLFFMNTLRINKQMVGEIQSMGENAIGIAGIDGDFLRTCRDDQGKKTNLQVNEKIVRDFLEKEYLPVITTMSRGRDQTVFFEKAGDVSCAVGACLQSEKIVFLGKSEGIYEEGTRSCMLIPQIKFEKIKDRTFLYGDMASVGKALSSGVRTVKILDGRIPHGLLMEIFAKDGIGTSIVL